LSADIEQKNELAGKPKGLIMGSLKHENNPKKWIGVGK